MMDGEESLFTIEESRQQLAFLVEAGIIKKEQLKECGIRTTVLREYYERAMKDEINKAAYIKIDTAIRKRYEININ